MIDERIKNRAVKSLHGLVSVIIKTKNIAIYKYNPFVLHVSL